MSVYRIYSLAGNDAGERPPGYYNTYRFYRNEIALYQCHVNHWCSKPSEFITMDDTQCNSFIMKSSRNFLPMTWLVTQKQTGALLGSLRRKILGKVDWIINDAGNKEVARFRRRYNSRFWLFRVIDFFVGDLPDGYEIVSNGKIIARMEKEQRPERLETSKKTGLFKLFSKVLNGSDWVIREQEDCQGLIDHRLLISGAVLLQQISRDISA